MSYEEAIADKLRPVGFDLPRLSPADRAEVRLLARTAGIELPQPGLVLSSHRDAERCGHESTHVDPRRS